MKRVAFLSGLFATLFFAPQSFATVLCVDSLTVGGETKANTAFEMTAEGLRSAYSLGFFPYTEINPETGVRELSWETMPQRGVLFFDEMHVMSRVKKAEKKVTDGVYRVTFDTAFAQVIHECASVPRKKFKKNPDGTVFKNPDGSLVELAPNYWITPEIKKAYTDLHKMGHAHSVEVWNVATGELVGGEYGVMLNGVYSGESTFHKEDDTSRIALYYLYDRLKSKGLKWIDLQMVTSESANWGARAVPRAEYMRMMEEAKKQNLKF